MGLNDEQAFRAIRFSLGKYNTGEEVDFVIEKVGSNVERNDRQPEFAIADENM